MNRFILTPFVFILICTINFSSSIRPEENRMFETETEALEALAYLSQLSAYPHIESPPGKFYAAYHHYKTQFIDHGGSRGGGWENIGPNNVGGRTISIAIDPSDTSVIYLGSASGGLWKSTSGGIGVDAWQYIPTGFPVLGVGAIAINPENSNEIIIGTGETYSYGTSTFGLITRTERGSFGVGILKSIDGGLTWNISLDWTYQENRGIWDLLYDPANTNIIIAATTEGIYKTTDGGLNWEQKLDEKMVMDIDMNLTSTNLLFAGVGNLTSADKGIYKSTDGGENWSLVTGGGLPAYIHDGRISISINQTNPDIILAVIGNSFSTQGIYKSVDGGSNWSEIDAEEVVSYQGWYAKGVLFHRDDTQKMLFGGVELWKTTNGGSVLTQMSEYIGTESPLHPDIHDIISNPLNPDLVYILTDGGLFRSNDFGETFYPCVDGYVTSQFYIGSMSSQTNDVGLGGLQDNFSQRYDGSKYWLAIIGGDGCFNAIDFEDDQIQYAAYQYASFLKSYDQGYNFYEDIYYPAGAAAFVAPLVICPSETNILYVGDTKLRRSDDAGGLFTTPDNAQADSGNVLLSIGVSTNSPDTVYYSTAGISGRADLFRSFDGGETKEAITNGLPDKYYRDIAVNKNNAHELFVCLSGYGSAHIYRSTNAGDTWTDVTADLPDVPFHSVLFDPTDDSIIYAGNDFAVFVSHDKGNTWAAMNEGWPDAAMVFDLYISPSDKKLVAATHGHGVYRTDLLGEEEQPVAIKENEITNISIYPTLVSDELIVNCDGQLNDRQQIQIFDMQGNLVLETRLISNQQKLSCGFLPGGNYIVCVGGVGLYVGEKFVKI